MSVITDIISFDESEYKPLFGEDIFENMNRAFFNGIVSKTDPKKKPTGGLVWYLQNAESDRDTTSRIVFFSAPDADTADELLNKYLEMAKEDDVKATFFEMDELSDEIKEVFEEKGFKVVQRESEVITITLKDAVNSKLMLSEKYHDHISQVDDLTLIQFRQIITSCLYSGLSGLYDDLAMLPKNWYEENISCCSFVNNRVKGALLIHPLSSGTLQPVLLYASGIDANINILHMLRFCMKNAVDKYPLETPVSITQNSTKVKMLVAALFPKVKGKTVFAGELKQA